MALARHCAPFARPDDRKGLSQLGTTLFLFLALAAILVAGVANGQWWTLPLALPAGGLIVRLFIIQHDCGHGSFFSRRDWNTLVGQFLSLVTLTPYDGWRRAHSLHHASSGDLGRRGIGDVNTLTVGEYRTLGRWRRLGYRFYRHPMVLHVIGPPLYFVLFQRLPFWQSLPARTVWRSVVGLDLALLLVYGGLALLFGADVVLLALLPPVVIASWIGGWMFYVQHQFEETHWSGADAWDMQVAALAGSSHYALPPLLHWFSGHVGLHHIHHLNARIPNYRLRECLDGDPRLGRVSRLTVADSLRSIGLALWDDETRRLVPFPRRARVCLNAPSDGGAAWAAARPIDPEGDHDAGRRP